MIKPYKGTCIDCKDEKWIINAKCQCEECRYKQNHGGKTKFEVELERQNNKPKKTYQLKRKPLKKAKITIKKEKRREVLNKDHETYLEVFNSKPNYCEETGEPLPDIFKDDDGNIVMISQYSHILSKSSHPEYRNCVWNFNRLSTTAHQEWEFGERKKMKIYSNNKQIVLENTGKDIL